MVESAVVQKLAFRHSLLRQTQKVADLSHQFLLLFLFHTPLPLAPSAAVLALNRTLHKSMAAPVRFPIILNYRKCSAPHCCAFLEVSSEQSSSPFFVKNILLDFVSDLLGFLQSSPFFIVFPIFVLSDF